VKLDFASEIASYKRLAPMGPEDKHVLLRFQVESADLKFEDNVH